MLDELTLSVLGSGDNRNKTAVVLVHGGALAIEEIMVRAVETSRGHGKVLLLQSRWSSGLVSMCMLAIPRLVQMQFWMHTTLEQKPAPLPSLKLCLGCSAQVFANVLDATSMLLLKCQCLYLTGSRTKPMCATGGKLPYSVMPSSFQNQSWFPSMSMTDFPGRTYRRVFPATVCRHGHIRLSVNSNYRFEMTMLALLFWVLQVLPIQCFCPAGAV